MNYFEMFNHKFSCIDLLMMKMMRRLSCKHPIFVLSCCRKSTSRVEVEGENQPVVTVDYLIESCGLSPEEAKKASKSFIRTYKVTPKPDFVLAFLRENGFTPTHIKTLIWKHPRFLCAKVDKTLRPKFAFFQQLGVSNAALANLCAKNPTLLLRSIDTHMRPTLTYLRTIVGTNDNLVKVIQRCSWIVACDHEKSILPVIEMLRESGLNQAQLKLFVLQRTRALFMPEQVREAIDRARKFGFEHPSPVLGRAIVTNTCLSVAAIDKKVKMFKSFGWTEEEIWFAFRKEPQFLTTSESKFRAVMGFLSGELKFSTCEIAYNPKLFRFSLEKRLVPRNKVLKVLKSRGWVKPELQLFPALYISDKVFLRKYVLPFSDRDPLIVDVFMAGVRG